MTEAESQHVLPGGTEPDPRCTLANERTFLASIRTSLALLAGGIALEAVTSHPFPGLARKGLAMFLLSTGMLLSFGSALRWVRVERSMLLDRLPCPHFNSLGSDDATFYFHKHSRACQPREAC